MINNYGVEMTNVSSSNVAAIGYDENNQMLYVRFIKNNSLYVYKNVPPMEYSGLLNAPSIGRYLHNNIKSYSYEKIE